MLSSHWVSLPTVKCHSCIVNIKNVLIGSNYVTLISIFTYFVDKTLTDLLHRFKYRSFVKNREFVNASFFVSTRRWGDRRRAAYSDKSNGKILKRLHRSGEELSLYDTPHGRGVLHLSVCVRVVCYREWLVGQLISSQGKCSLQISPSLFRTRY